MLNFRKFILGAKTKIVETVKQPWLMAAIALIVGIVIYVSPTVVMGFNKLMYADDFSHSKDLYDYFKQKDIVQGRALLLPMNSISKYDKWNYLGRDPILSFFPVQTLDINSISAADSDSYTQTLYGYLQNYDNRFFNHLNLSNIDYVVIRPYVSLEERYDFKKVQEFLDFYGKDVFSNKVKLDSGDVIYTMKKKVPQVSFSSSKTIINSDIRTLADSDYITNGNVDLRNQSFEFYTQENTPKIGQLDTFAIDFTKPIIPVKNSTDFEFKQSFDLTKNSSFNVFAYNGDYIASNIKVNDDILTLESVPFNYRIDSNAFTSDSFELAKFSLKDYLDTEGVVKLGRSAYKIDLNTDPASNNRFKNLEVKNLMLPAQTQVEIVPTPSGDSILANGDFKTGLWGEVEDNYRIDDKPRSVTKLDAKISDTKQALELSALSHSAGQSKRFAIPDSKNKIYIDFKYETEYKLQVQIIDLVDKSVNFNQTFNKTTKEERFSTVVDIPKPENSQIIVLSSFGDNKNVTKSLISNIKILPVSETKRYINVIDNSKYTVPLDKIDLESGKHTIAIEAPITDPKNYIENGDFEEGKWAEISDNNKKDDRTIEQVRIDSGTSNDAFSGTKSMYLSALDHAAGTYRSIIDYDKGYLYYTSIMYKNIVGNKVKTGFFQETSNVYNPEAFLDPSKKWKEYNSVFLPNKNTTNLAMYLTVYGEGRSDYSTLFDQINIQKILKPPSIVLKPATDIYSIPESSYQEISPVEYQIKIKDASSPFVINFYQNINSNWVLIDENGKEVGDKFTLNGFMQGWQVDKQGSYTLRVQFKRNEFYQISILFSMGFTLICLLLVLILFIKDIFKADYRLLLKKFFKIALVFVGLSLLPFILLFLRNGSLAIYIDPGIPPFIDQAKMAMSMRWFSWVNTDFGQAILYPAELYNNFITYILLTVIPNPFTVIKIMIWLSYFLSGLGMFLLLRHYNLHKIASFVAALFYMYSPLLFTKTMTSHRLYTLGYALVPFIVLSFILSLKAKQLYKRFGFLLISIVLFILAISQVQFLVLIPIIIFLSAFYFKFNNIKRFIIHFAVLVFASVIGHVFWIVPLLTGAAKISDNAGLEKLTSFEVYKNFSVSLPNSIRVTGYLTPFWETVQVLLPQQVYNILVLLVIFGAVGVTFYFVKYSRAVKAFLLTVLILTWIYITGVKLDGVRYVFEFLTDRFLFLGLFRELFNLSMLLVYTYSLIFAISLHFLLKKAEIAKLHASSVEVEPQSSVS